MAVDNSGVLDEGAFGRHLVLRYGVSLCQATICDSDIRRKFIFLPDNQQLNGEFAMREEAALESLRADRPHFSLGATREHCASMTVAQLRETADTLRHVGRFIASAEGQAWQDTPLRNYDGRHRNTSFENLARTLDDHVLGRDILSVEETVGQLLAVRDVDFLFCEFQHKLGRSFVCARLDSDRVACVEDLLRHQGEMWPGGEVHSDLKTRW